ncbi:MAG: TetR family transcriptional regulator [Candidatus Solibacter sp.]
MTPHPFKRMIQSIDSIKCMRDTKEKILDTAERLFAEQGFAATSLRQVIGEAQVNVAAVHYHFGSKEDLLDAVVVRKVAPVNEARHAWLDRVVAEAGDRTPGVRQVLEAFLLPTAETANRSPDFVRLMGRMFSEGMMPALVEKHFHATGMRFVDELRRAIPHLSHEELLWRVHFMIGAMSHTLCMAPVLPGLADSSAGMELRMKHLVNFLAAGLCAPATKGLQPAQMGKGKEK